MGILKAIIGSGPQAAGVQLISEFKRGFSFDPVSLYADHISYRRGSYPLVGVTAELVRTGGSTAFNAQRGQLHVDGPEFSWVIDSDHHHLNKATQFASAVNLAARKAEQGRGTS